LTFIGKLFHINKKNIPRGTCLLARETKVTNNMKKMCASKLELSIRDIFNDNINKKVFCIHGWLIERWCGGLHPSLSASPYLYCCIIEMQQECTWLSDPSLIDRSLFFACCVCSCNDDQSSSLSSRCFNNISIKTKGTFICHS
jgi:hypothetical protein